MRSFKIVSLVAAALMASTAMSQAADILVEPQPELPPEVVPHYGAGGWYIRGDIGYAKLDAKRVDFFQGVNRTGIFSQAEYDETWAIQGGIGYQITDYFRVDATIKYLASSDFSGNSAPGAGVPCNGFPANTCSFTDNSELEYAAILLANAYIDLGTYNGFTPYVGAGIGGAKVRFGNLVNDQTCDPAAPVGCSDNDSIHAGASNTRFAYALHAGASYDLTCRTKLDGGYSFTRIEGGDFFGTGVGTAGSLAPGVALGGNGFDRGIEIHEGRIGVRYSLSDAGCHSPNPEPPVVYK